MQAPETTEIVEATENRVRGACLVAGCTCKDSRIVSHRRAAFFAWMARRSGQTADRVVAVEPAWQIPTAPVADFEVPSLSEGPGDLGESTEAIQAPASD